MHPKAEESIFDCNQFKNYGKTSARFLNKLNDYDHKLFNYSMFNY